MSHINKQSTVVKSFSTFGDTLVYPVTHNLVDLFWGTGFTNQARFKFARGVWELWNKSKGYSLPRDYMNTLSTYKENRNG